MFFNAYQKYIAELIDEYGSLLKSQLLRLVNQKFNAGLANLDGYIMQMCCFADFAELPQGGDTVVLHRGHDPDYDAIRSVEVMLGFLKNLVRHNKSRGYVSVRFYVTAKDGEKEICVVPVKTGAEQQVSAYAADKFDAVKSEIVIFLLDNKDQMRLINTDCNCRFALVTDNGAVFFKK